MSSEELIDALMDFCNAVEAGVAQLKKNLYDLMQQCGNAKPVWDLEKVKWEKAQSDKGEYEKATAEANKDNADFNNLVADLKMHGGKMRKGNFFIWLFEKTQELTVGRKRVK